MGTDKMTKIFNKTIERIKTFFKYRELFFQLVSKNIKLKYRRSVFGYLWTVLNPLLSMLVIYTVFSQLFSRSIPNFPIYILSGQLIFHFMTGAVSTAMSSITGHAALLKKIYIPKYIFTLSQVTSELIVFFFSLISFLIVVIISKTPITIRYLYVIIPIIQLYVFCIGLGLFLAQTAVFFRDIYYIWHIVSTAWMFLSCIFYSVDILPENVKHIITHYNPMYFYITMFRNFTMGAPGMGSLDLVIRGAVAAVSALFLGLVTFSINKNKFILYI